jgi:hypothetical protein
MSKIVFKRFDKKRWIVEMPTDKNFKPRDISPELRMISDFLGVPEKNIFLVWGVEVEVKR